MKSQKILSLLLVLVLTLSGCSRDKPSNNDNNEMNEQLLTTITRMPDIPSITPNIDQAEDITPLPAEDFFIPITYVEDESYIFNYFNYINKSPIVKIADYVYEFSYDGTIRLSDTVKNQYEEFHITEKLNTDSFASEFTSENSWFYMGYLLTNECFFLRYDYIDQESYSLLYRMDLSGNNISLCITNTYYEKEMLNNFIIVDEHIYYTLITKPDKDFVTSLIRTDLSGNHEETVYTFDKNIEVQYLFPYEQSLYMITNTKYNAKSLQRYDFDSNKLTAIVNNCAADFLYIYDNCALLSIHEDTHLYYYSMNKNKYEYLKLRSGTDTYFSPPFASGNAVYVTTFSWESPSKTKLAKLNLANKSIETKISSETIPYNLIGLTGSIAYVEINGTYKAFDIESGTEISLYK